MPLFGILNVNKPLGWTSFQVVALVRRLSGERRVGHAGTLDPLASGVLPICLGQATRLVEYLVDTVKVYRAQVQLGVATDTYDAEGRPTYQGDASALALAEIEAALASFVGRIRQKPPPFSALKYAGKPLYHYARAGIAIDDSKEREVVVHSLQVEEFQPPLLTILVECGKGTYLRSLAHDLGRLLGCGAYLRSLVRTRVGPFALEEACAPDELKGSFAQGQWRQLLYYPDVVLTHWWAAILGDESEREMRLGRALPALSAIGGQERARTSAQGDYCRAYSWDGHLIGILRYQDGAGLWQPAKVFSPPREE